MSERWNKKFKRIPVEMFNDPIWNKKPFSKQQAYVHMYSLSHDGKESVTMYDDNNKLFEVHPGEVIKGCRELGNVFGWSKSKVHRWIKEMVDAKYFSVRTDKGVTIISLLGFIPVAGQSRDKVGITKRQERDSDEMKAGLIYNIDNNIYNNNNKREVARSKIEKIYCDFIGNQEVEVPASVAHLIKEAIEETSCEEVARAVKNYTDSGISKDAHWFFKQDYHDFLKSKSKPKFRKAATGLTIAYCNICYEKHHPDDYQLRTGPECCKSEGAIYIPNEPSVDVPF